MKCSLILVIVLVFAVNSEAFLFTKLKLKKLFSATSFQHVQTTSTEPPPPPPMIDLFALIGPLIDLKTSLTNSLRDQVNQKFDQKIQHLNSFRDSFSKSGTGSISSSSDSSPKDDSFSLDDSSDSESAFYEVKIDKMSLR